jgi:GT2 family glycosyltransferase
VDSAICYTPRVDDNVDAECLTNEGNFQQAADAISVLIVTWNGLRFLKRCLHAVADQTYRKFEVVLVDNGSKDESWKLAPEILGAIPHRIQRLEQNTGFAAANNIAAQIACGRWLALLNQDAYPTPDWLAKLMETARQFPGYASFASCQLMASDSTRIDGAGDGYLVSGLAWRKLHGAPISMLPRAPHEVFSACGAAALYRREAFLRLGGFEEKYFSYHEDVDFGFRLRLIGEGCLFVPDALVYHEGGVYRPETSAQANYLGHRNLEFTYWTDVPTLLLFLTFPFHLIYLIGAFLVFLIAGKATSFLRAKRDALRMLPWMLERRRKNQRVRTVGSWDLLRHMNLGAVDTIQRMIYRGR